MRNYSVIIGTECLNTRFPLPTLLCAGYSVKLIRLVKLYNFHKFHNHCSKINSKAQSLIYVAYFQLCPWNIFPVVKCASTLYRVIASRFSLQITITKWDVTYLLAVKNSTATIFDRLIKPQLISRCVNFVLLMFLFYHIINYSGEIELVLIL